MSPGLHVRTYLSHAVPLWSRPRLSETSPRTQDLDSVRAESAPSSDDVLGRWEVDGGQVATDH